MEQAKGSPLFCGRVLHSSSLILTGMLMTPPEPRKRKIGFIVKERAAKYGKSEISRGVKNLDSFPLSSCCLSPNASCLFCNFALFYAELTSAGSLIRSHL